MGRHLVTASPVIFFTDGNGDRVHSISAHTVLSEGITSDHITNFKKLKTACHTEDHIEGGAVASVARISQLVSHLRTFGRILGSCQQALHVICHSVWGWCLQMVWIPR